MSYTNFFTPKFPDLRYIIIIAMREWLTLNSFILVDKLSYNNH